MKAELVKREDRYDLYNKSDGSKIASTVSNPFGMLSLKNCQAIERGFDLDELAKERFGNSSHHTNNRCSFREGFQKCLELMGDKKFSEGNMLDCWNISAGNRHTWVEFMDSLQQNEWDVEIEMDILNEYDKPKLNADGCLILKRK